MAALVAVTAETMPCPASAVGMRTSATMRLIDLPLSVMTSPMPTVTTSTAITAAKPMVKRWPIRRLPSAFMRSSPYRALGSPLFDRALRCRPSRSFREE
jgi:hypothetical protein